MDLDAGASFPTSATIALLHNICSCVPMNQGSSQFVPVRVSLKSCSQFIPEGGDARPLAGTAPLQRGQPHLCTPITALVSDSLDYVVCPCVALLSAAGSLSFQDQVSHIEAAPFQGP